MKTINSLRSKLLALTLALMASVSSFAYDYHGDLLCYNVLTDSTVAVTGQSEYKTMPRYEYLPENLVIPSEVTLQGKTYKVVSIDQWAFYACTMLKSVTIPSSVTFIGMSAFHYCENLVYVDIPTSVTTVEGSAFSYTKWYDNLPDGEGYINNTLYRYKGTAPENTQIVVKDGTTRIAGYTFWNQSNIVSIELPQTLTVIEHDAFEGCTQLSSILIPKNVTDIGASAFADCTGLTEVICLAPTPPTMGQYANPSADSEIFARVDVSNTTLYVRSESVEAYKNVDQWKDFGQILPIEPTSYKSQWCDTWNVAMFSVGPDRQVNTFRYQLVQDTVVDGQTYTVLNCKATAEPNTLNIDLGIVRFADDRKVYANYNGKEYLVYDFSVQIGDTLDVLINAWGDDTQKCLVHNVSIDEESNRTIITLHVYDEYRKEFINDDYSTIKWIEGIGSENGFFEGVEKFVDGGGAKHLICAYQGDELKYTGDLYEEYGCGDDAEQSPEDLFPTLWGLQRTSLTVKMSPTLFSAKTDVRYIKNKAYLDFHGYFLREENNQVLVYSGLQEEDLVLYDYSLEVGDTLTTLNYDYRIEGVPLTDLVVDYPIPDPYGSYDPIDTLIVTNILYVTLLDGKEYKQWTFNNGMQYVEGIGQFGQSIWAGDFFALIRKPNGFTWPDTRDYLVCASKNGKLLYQMDDAEMERLGAECLCEYTAELTPEDLFPTLWGLQRTDVELHTTGDNELYRSTFNEYIHFVPSKKQRIYLTYDRQTYLREENNQVLLYAPSYGINEDIVLYDWTLEKNDTLQVGLYDEIERGKLFRVTDVSTVTLLDGKEYKKWTLACGIEYIEGIGAINGEGFGNYLCLQHKAHPATYIGSPLVCASRNGKLLYQMDDEEMERLGAECLCDYNSGPKKDNAKNGKIGGRPTPTQWNMLEFETKEVDGTPTITRAETFSYTLENDSIVIKGKTFYQLARQSTKDTAITKSFVGALHFGEDEDNRVYFLSDGVEYVLYDFTAEPGDTIDIFAGINNYPQHTTYTHVVTGKDTLENGACRMMLEVVFPEETSSVENAQKVWLAGLGSIDGIVHNAATRTTKARSSETQTSVMLCAWRDDDCLYTTDHPDYDSYGCVYNLPTSIKDIETPGGKCQKLIRDGHLYILRDNKLYDVLGTPLN